MTRFRFAVLLLIAPCSVFCQLSADSLLQVIRSPNSDSLRITATMDLICTFGYIKQESVFNIAKRLIKVGEEKNYPPAVALGYISMSYALFRQDNKAAALENSIRSLKIAEKYNNKRCLAMVYNGLGLCYPDDDWRSNKYRYMGLDVLKENGDSKEKVILMLNMGRSFEAINNVDSALFYESEAFEMALRMKDISDKAFIRSAMVWSLTSLGNSYRQLGQNELSTTYYREALRLAVVYKYPYPIIAAYEGLVQYFKAIGNKDSAVYYNKLLLQTAAVEGATYQIKPSQYLYEYYKALKNQDSAFKYLEVYNGALIRVDSARKTIKMMTLSFEEESRQKELLLQREIIAQDRRRNLQYAAIAIGLIIFIIVYLFLSRSIIVKTTFIQFFSILGLLAVFEFINLLIHPYLAEFTHNSPILMLLALIGIGALLIPVHHKLEKKLTQLMVEKNKSIRLAAAKKTIATLEG